jgi:hypothetical protein
MPSQVGGFTAESTAFGGGPSGRGGGAAFTGSGSFPPGGDVQAAAHGEKATAAGFCDGGAGVGSVDHGHGAVPGGGGAPRVLASAVHRLTAGLAKLLPLVAGCMATM